MFFSIGVNFTESRPLLDRRKKCSCRTTHWPANEMELTTPKGLTLLHLLVILFGITAWLGVNATFVQLPLLVEKAPEGWSLPSFIVIMIQIGNLGPLLYTTVQKWKPFQDSPWIVALLVLGCISSILFAFFHTKTATLLGADRSVAILSIAFCFALVGCTSSVLFMPYMGRFKEVYLVTYLIGEGLSGLVPSVVALVQGVGGNSVCMLNNSTGNYEPTTPPPRFGVQTFYLFVFSVFVISTIAFIFLDHHPKFKQEYVAKRIQHGNDYSYDPEPSTSQAEEQQNSSSVKFQVQVPQKILSTSNYIFLLMLLGFVCLLVNGVVPSVQSYSCLPYGNIAYHLAVTLSAIANPTACFLAFFLPHKSIRMISYLTAISMIFAVYALATAFLSPPPFKGTWIGEFLVVSFFFFSYPHSYFLLKNKKKFYFSGHQLDFVNWFSQFYSPRNHIHF